MGIEFNRGVGRSLTVAVVVAGALMAFATTSHANRCGGGGYSRGSACGPSRFSGAGYHRGYRRGYGGGYGRGYAGCRSYRPVRCYRGPRSTFSLGIGIGYRPYYAPPAYVYSPPRVYRERVYVDRDDDRTYDREDHRDSDRNDRDYDREDRDSDRDDRDYDRDDGDASRPLDEIDVENTPPAGTYYRDTYCNRTFSTLDDYTEHLDSKHHAQTIDIIERDSGQRVRTLEFVDGYWQVQK